MEKHNSSDGRSATRKELARARRRDAYRQAKERWANDPRTIAMKEAQKARRRESYQQAKQRNKERASAAKGAAKERAERELAESRAAADAELMKLITVTARGSDAVN
jgi:hypothetical protein